MPIFSWGRWAKEEADEGQEGEGSQRRR